jgi:hypothetical protein
LRAFIKDERWSTGTTGDCPTDDFFVPFAFDNLLGYYDSTRGAAAVEDLRSFSGRQNDGLFLFEKENPTLFQETLKNEKWMCACFRH